MLRAQNQFPQAGILAIWNDVVAGREADFETWFQTEHMEERLSVPGFRFGRRHEAMSGDRRYFIFYETDTPEILTSAAYLDRVNNPTPQTKLIMSDVFRNMTRAVCRRVAQCGAVRGAFAVTARFENRPDDATLMSVLDGLNNDTGVACGEIWATADAGIPVSTEERLRGGDLRIQNCLLVETLRQSDAARVAQAVSDKFGRAAQIGIFRLLCEHRCNP